MTKASKIITDLHNYSNHEIPSCSGCYILQSEFIEGLARIGGIDRKGTIYIGTSTNLKKRISSFTRSILSNYDHNQKNWIVCGHKTFSKKFYRLRHHVDVSKFSISYYSINELDSKYLESFMLEYYVSKFGELPPLNGNYGHHSVVDSLIYLKTNEISVESIKQDIY